MHGKPSLIEPQARGRAAPAPGERAGTRTCETRTASRRRRSRHPSARAHPTRCGAHAPDRQREGEIRAVAAPAVTCAGRSRESPGGTRWRLERPRCATAARTTTEEDFGHDGTGHRWSSTRRRRPAGRAEASRRGVRSSGLGGVARGGRGRRERLPERGPRAPGSTRGSSPPSRPRPGARSSRSGPAPCRRARD